MANKPAGIVGFVVALVIVGALVATPFYMGTLRSDAQALDDAVREDVEAVRRAVLNLDEDLAAYVSMTASVGPPAEEPADEGYRTPPGFPDDDPVFKKSLIRDLNQSIEMLQRVQEHDRERGTTVLGTETIERRKLKVDRTVTDFKNKYLKSGEKLLREAESRLSQLRSVTRGTASSANHLGVNRIKGIFFLAKGRIQANGAEFERLRATAFRRTAQERVPALLQLKRQVEAIDAQMPAERLAAIDQRLQGTQTGLAALRGVIQQLGGIVAARQEQVAELERSSAEARQGLAELGTQRMAFGDYSSRYLELSAEARKAESEATALRTGTLRGAKPVETFTADPTPPVYEGGAPDAGLDTLTFRLEQLKGQESALKNMQKELESQRASVAELEQSLKRRRGEIVQQIDGQSSQVQEVLAQAAAHEEKADKAAEDAIKSLKEAARAAKDAVKAAKDVTNEARQSASAGGNVDERLQRVSQDVDTEASMHCLAAECAYSMALLRSEKIQALREQAKITGWLAAATGGEATANVSEMDKLQTDAANEAADALKSYDLAAALIGKASYKADNTSISGKNYLWQVQVGKAAVHLLLAAIHASDPEKSATERALAYDLLKEAAEKREQSPLLTPAIETIVYLQKSAK
ncbi:MAG TPA: hypothetical protein VJZ71_19425 [Phycisphaerae bacterium]|nr:hypothetical protein [Phycisphaerae bacterium]